MSLQFSRFKGFFKRNDFSPSFHLGRTFVPKAVPRSFFQTSRNLENMLKFYDDTLSLNLIENHGCHCLPNSIAKYQVSKSGKPIDDLDNACKQHKACTACLNITNLENPCRWTKNYKITNINKSLRCVDAADTCARRLCECDLRFVDQVYKSLNKKFKKSECPIHKDIEHNIGPWEFHRSGTQSFNFLNHGKLRNIWDR